MDAASQFKPSQAAQLSFWELDIVFSGTWWFPKTISDYQEGFECFFSYRPMPIFNSAFKDSHWQAGMIFPALISPKARQTRNMIPNKWAISASWLFPIELYLFCVTLHCCLGVITSILNFSSPFFSLSKSHSWIAHTSSFSAYIRSTEKKIIWKSLCTFSEISATESEIYSLEWRQLQAYLAIQRH